MMTMENQEVESMHLEDPVQVYNSQSDWNCNVQHNRDLKDSSIVKQHNQ